MISLGSIFLSLFLTGFLQLSGCKSRENSSSEAKSASDGKSASLIEEILSLSPQKKIPYPFENLIAHIEKTSGSPAVGLIVPFGRSLQKFAGRENYFKFPRVIVGFDKSFHEPYSKIFPDTNGKLFLGYVEPSNQVEIISYNTSSGENDFFAIEKYAKGQSPELVKLENFRCNSCHVRNLGVFSPEPWSEFNGNPMISEMIKKYHGDRHLGIRVAQGQGVTGGAESAHFEGIVAKSFLTNYVQKIWRELCEHLEDPNQCRAGLIVNGLSREIFKINFALPLEITRLTLDENKRKEFASYQIIAVISDYDLEAGIEDIDNDSISLDKVSENCKDIASGNFKIVAQKFSDLKKKLPDISRSEQLMIECVLEIAFLQPFYHDFVDPRFRRTSDPVKNYNQLPFSPPDVIELFNDASSKLVQNFFTATDRNRIRNTLEGTRPIQTLEKLYESLVSSELTSSKIFSRRDFLDHVNKNFKDGKDWQFLKTSDLASTSPPTFRPPVFEGRVSHAGLNILLNRCARCHNGSIENIPVFLKSSIFENGEKSAWERVKPFKNQIIEAVSAGSGTNSYMPPSEVVQNAGFTSSEREVLIKELKKL